MSISPSASDYWDREHVDGVMPLNYWTHHPLLDAYALFMMTGDAKFRNSVEWFGERFLGRFRPLPAVLGASVGCGTGTAERQALAAGLSRRMEGFDLSPASLDKARAHARSAGLESRLRYAVKDLNSEGLPGRTYDFVLSFGCLHHLENLEHGLAAIHDSLMPDGLFYFNEYVGPSRFRWSSEFVDKVNAVRNILPAQSLKPRPFRRLEEGEILDPSEAVRSEDIMEAVRDRFELLDVRYYGGTLLFPLWGDVVHPEIFLDMSRDAYRSLLHVLILLDDSWTRTFGGLFVQAVACRKDAPPDRVRVGRAAAGPLPSVFDGPWAKDLPGEGAPVSPGKRKPVGLAAAAANAVYRTLVVWKTLGIRAIFWKFKWRLRERSAKNRRG
jgi:SAM-dependent methyltransferase